LKVKLPALCLVSLIIGIGCQVPTTTTSRSSEPVNPTPAAPVTESAWQVDREVNPVTGVTTITASLKYQGSRNIIVREIGKKLECYIETDEFLETLDNMHTGISTVQYKFDDGKVIRQGWTLSADNEALFYPGNCAPLLNQLRKAKSFAFEFHPADKVPAAITFDVSGFPDDFNAEASIPSKRQPVAHVGQSGN